jgi:SWI/SNF-related matrix-associated actin-dependent regulator of chromatin subfamily A-like protein 1
VAKFRSANTPIRVVEYLSDDFYLVHWRTKNEQAFNNIKNFVKSLDGALFLFETKRWRVRITEENTLKLRNHGFKFVGKAYFLSHGKQGFAQIEKQTPPLDLTITKKDLDPELRQYQVEGVQMLSGLRGVALLSDPMGSGKSAQVSSYLKILNKFPILIVCPAGLREMWARELKRWGGIDSYICERMDTILTTFDAQAYIISYNLLDSWMRELLDLDHFKIMIVDECQYLLNPQSIRSKRVKYLVKDIPRFIAISGTPMKSRAREFWTVLNIIAPDIFDNEAAFLEFFCNPKATYFGVEYEGTSNADILHNLVSPFMIRRDKEVILPELPPINRICVPLCLTDAKKFSKIEKSLTNEDGEVIGEKEAKELYHKLFEYKATSVIEWIETWLEQNPGEKLVVAAYHIEALNILMDYFHSIALCIDGSVLGGKRQKIVDQFQEDDKHRIIFLQIIAGGVGYTLTRASSMVIAELWFVPGDLAQVEARIHRVTTKAPSVNVYYLLGVNTIEERIYKKVDQKQLDVSAVLDGKAQKFFTEEAGYVEIS